MVVRIHCVGRFHRGETNLTRHLGAYGNAIFSFFVDIVTLFMTFLILLTPLRADELERHRREKLLRIAQCSPESFVLTASVCGGGGGAVDAEKTRRGSNHDNEGGDDGAASAPETDNAAAGNHNISRSGSKGKHAGDDIESDDESQGISKGIPCTVVVRH